MNRRTFQGPLWGRILIHWTTLETLTSSCSKDSIRLERVISACLRSKWKDCRRKSLVSWWLKVVRMTLICSSWFTETSSMAKSSSLRSWLTGTLMLCQCLQSQRRWSMILVTMKTTLQCLSLMISLRPQTACSASTLSTTQVTTSLPSCRVSLTTYLSSRVVSKLLAPQSLASAPTRACISAPISRASTVSWSRPIIAKLKSARAPNLGFMGQTLKRSLKVPMIGMCGTRHIVKHNSLHKVAPLWAVCSASRDPRMLTMLWWTLETWRSWNARVKVVFRHQIGLTRRFLITMTKMILVSQLLICIWKIKSLLNRPTRMERTRMGQLLVSHQSLRAEKLRKKINGRALRKVIVKTTANHPTRPRKTLRMLVVPAKFFDEDTSSFYRTSTPTFNHKKQLNWQNNISRQQEKGKFLFFILTFNYKFISFYERLQLNLWKKL